MPLSLSINIKFNNLKLGELSNHITKRWKCVNWPLCCMYNVCSWIQLVLSKNKKNPIVIKLISNRLCIRDHDSVKVYPVLMWCSIWKCEIDEDFNVWFLYSLSLSLSFHWILLQLSNLKGLFPKQNIQKIERVIIAK